MTTDHHRVRALLDQLADHAPAPDQAIDVHRLLPRIRRRRRTRMMASAVAPIVAAVAIGGLLLSVSGRGPADDSMAQRGEGPPGLGPQTALGRCGGPVTPMSPDVATTALAVTAVLPAEVRAGAGQALTATLRVTNRGDRPIHGFTATPAQLLLVAGGIIVAAPSGTRDVATVIDLAPGATVELPVTLPLQRCDAASTPPDAVDKTPVTPPAGVPLPAGDYQAYGALDVQRTDDGGPSGTAIVVRGGPWEVRLR